MSDLYQTNVSSSKTIKRSLSEARVQLSFVVLATSPGVYPQFIEGEQVVLNSSGQAVKRIAAGDKTVGVVVVPNSTQNGQQITVAMQGSILQSMGATETIAVGDKITSVGINTSITPNRPNATIATTGNYADGVALSGGAVNTEIQVLMYASPVLIP